MENTSIVDLVKKDYSGISSFIDEYIKSSNKIKIKIKEFVLSNLGDNDEIDENMSQVRITNTVLGLMRDTYLCNLLMGVTALMYLTSGEDRYDDLHIKIKKFVDDYHYDPEFRMSLYLIYKYYLKYEVNFEHQLFLERALCKSIDVEDEIDMPINKNSIEMKENKLISLINVITLYKGKALDENLYEKVIESMEDNLYIDNDMTVEDIIQTNMKVYDEITKFQFNYSNKQNQCLESLSELISARNKFAQEKNYDNYHKYMNRDKSDVTNVIIGTIEQLEKDMKIRVDEELNNVVNSKPYISTASIGDIKKYSRDLICPKKFELFKVLHVIFLRIKHYFGIDFVRSDFDKESSKIELLQRLVRFNVMYKGDIIGRLFLDLTYNEAKPLRDPLSIKLADRFKVSNLHSGKHTSPEVLLMVNYNSDLLYTDVVKLFEEFGYVLYDLCYTSTIGRVNDDMDVSNFIPLVLHNIAWDRDTINMFVKDESIGDHLEMSRYFTKCSDMLIEIVRGKFDYVVHNDNKLIDAINDDPKIINQVYMKLLNDTFSNSKFNPTLVSSTVCDIPTSIRRKYDISMVDPIAIGNVIDGTSCSILPMLCNRIFAYAAFYNLKNGLRTSDEFFEILSNGLTSQKESIFNFLSNIDPYTVYIEYCLLLNVKDQNSEDNDININNVNNTNYDNTNYDITENYDDIRN